MEGEDFKVAIASPCVYIELIAGQDKRPRKGAIYQLPKARVEVIT
jgi:hypothetical protein